MDESSTLAHTLTFEQLVELREKTEAMAQFLHKQLMAYLDTLRLLLAPRRLLGKYVGVKEDVAGADKALAQIRAAYHKASGKPLALPPELDESLLRNLENRLEIYPWEYSHQATSGGDTKTVTITSPVRWVVTYGGGATLSQALQAMSGKEPRQVEPLCQFVVNALVMQAVLARYPGITQLLTDLRYHIRTETSPALGELPLVTVSACLPSFRPADSLILTATRFSGVPAFIELIDPEALHTLPDPLKLRLEELCR